MTAYVIVAQSQRLGISYLNHVFLSKVKAEANLRLLQANTSFRLDGFEFWIEETAFDGGRDDNVEHISRSVSN